MWIQAILSKEDLVVALGQLLPLKIHLDKDPSTERWLFLDKATDIELVSERGLRVACPAELMWSVGGLDIPIKLHTMRLMVRPEILSKTDGDVLAFLLELEEADFKGIPGLIDRGIMRAINASLADREFAWNFTRTLTRTVRMPSTLDPIDSLSIRVNWGKCRVDAEGFALAVSFELTFDRGTSRKAQMETETSSETETKTDEDTSEENEERERESLTTRYRQSDRAGDRDEDDEDDDEH
jgi:hypothetical protein